MFTPENVAAASTEVSRLQRELDITNADHIGLWLEANMEDSSLAWLSCRIIEAHEAVIACRAGYAPGNYSIRCVGCQQVVDGCDKRAIRCASCATPATTVDETERLREAVISADWLNLMPREVVARAALNEGCRDKTADDIRQGLHGDVKIRAEVAVKLVGFIQNEVRAALSDRPQAEGEVK